MTKFVNCWVQRNRQHSYGGHFGGDFPDGINIIPDSHADETTTRKENNDPVSRLNLADLLYTEYSLEEVIYQLAKAMFTQSLSQGKVIIC